MSHSVNWHGVAESVGWFVMVLFGISFVFIGIEMISDVLTATHRLRRLVWWFSRERKQENDE